jgi:hypothetical protein
VEPFTRNFVGVNGTRTEMPAAVNTKQVVNKLELPSALKELFNGLEDGEVVEMILPRHTKPPHAHCYYLTRVKNSAEILLLLIDREIEVQALFNASLFTVDNDIKFHRVVSRVKYLPTEDSSNRVKEDLKKIIFGENNGFGNTSIRFGNNKPIITSAPTGCVGGELEENSGKQAFIGNIIEARSKLTKNTAL